MSSEPGGGGVGVGVAVGVGDGVCPTGEAVGLGVGDGVWPTGDGVGVGVALFGVGDGVGVCGGVVIGPLLPQPARNAASAKAYPTRRVEIEPSIVTFLRHQKGDTASASPGDREESRTTR
jgi:hypothetical protein